MKCAIYTRVSTSMQAEKEYNSCEAQKDKILSYIKSQEDLKFSKEYSDPGFSGGDLKRPGLNELLRDIQEKKIDVVLTYKIDRLTRSSKDFYALIEFFEKHNVSYVSVTERFDTSSSAGRLLRNIMLTFAQFEREMTGERIKDKLEQKAKRGFWNGSVPPLGYKKVGKKLVVDQKKALLVKEIFEKLVETGHFFEVLDLARKSGVCVYRTGRPITTNGLYYLLRNPIYIGKITWRGQYLPGIHEPIISEDLFLAAQSRIKDKVRKKPLYKEYLLSPLVKCSECGSTMTNTFTNKKKRRYYYYKCVKVTKQGKDACSIKEVNAEKLENFILENLERISKDRTYIESLAFKILRRPLPSSGNELSPESEKKLVEKVLYVLQRYASDYRSGSQLEKKLTSRRAIQKIIFAKETLEVFINIEDTRSSALGRELEGRRLFAVAGEREGTVNFDAPACRDVFDTQKT
jgi:DNA invertase Pin-like site-specific DNA recombinase